MKMKMLAMLLATVPLLGTAAAPAYRIDILDREGVNGSGALNNAGQALIVRAPSNDDFRTYLTTTSSSVDLGTLGGTMTSSSAINNAGVVAGTSTLAGNTARHAFVYANGSMLDLGTFGGTDSRAVAINDAGTVVGNAENASGDTRGFVYTAQGGMRDIGTLGGAQTMVSDVSESGEVLGYSQTASGEWHNYLYKDGAMTDIDSWRGELNGFGPNGEIFGSVVGWRDLPELVIYRSDWQPGVATASAMADGYMVGWDWNGTITYLSSRDGTWSLNELAGDGWSFHHAEGVNDLGQVLAWGCYYGDDEFCANVLLSPVPEPATYGMLGLGLGVVALARRRRAAAISRSA
ncbi:HAF repeat-containing PEP-CTERM protein [Pseudoduganella umbonata]|uniref:PEP-CTERM sorting domain-containing protein n=1 Tax=Pseudoduganella umbonata TaxID=864828 RepID=A0A4P8HMW5_9BURK|nr:HAF repeat-containing PEP-CTERM protein [Pseudoduganella umbonata]MBB3222443.1 putative HAF family extracellular repeat protein [Pseudoduganella umbonata]QCP11013.1 PEP-CTERM sorting domain-containing protein [Pseudoduganella umbonata]